METKLKLEEVAVDHVLSTPTEPTQRNDSQAQLSQSSRQLQRHAATKQAFFLQEIIPQGL